MTGALFAALALVAAAAPASAGFVYVPPAPAQDGGIGPGAAQADSAESASGRTEGLRPGQKEPASEGAGPGRAAADESPSGPGPALWRVHAGETLRAALGRWGARAGTDVLFLTDRRYRLEGAAAFEGGFMDAVQALFRRLSHLPHAPVAARSEGGAALVVTHRPPRPPETGDGP